MIEGHELGTTVEYYVEGADEAGNAGVSFTNIFMTPAAPRKGIPLTTIGAVLVIIIVGIVIISRRQQSDLS